MEIRKALPEDLPKILEVLRASLGEGSSRKNEEVWNYKHVDNPFGKSLVLVAEENKEILGVRAFMRWVWCQNDHRFFAYRAVDTATHPKHQGKGIFKKLTLKAIEIAKQEDGSFIFNTPNNQSLPGYLKMGWEKVNKINTVLVPQFRLPGTRHIASYEHIGDIENISSGFLNNWNQGLNFNNLLYTPKNKEYLLWRYFYNPLQEYQIICEQDFFMAGYIKQQGKFRELRISELIFNTKQSEKHAKRIIAKWASSFKANVISYHLPGKKTSIHNLGISGNFGPILTTRELNKTEIDLNEIRNWGYSLGDLELF